MKKLLLLAALTALALSAPATAGAAKFSGVVVAKNAKRHTLAVASHTCPFTRPADYGRAEPGRAAHRAQPTGRPVDTRAGRGNPDRVVQDGCK